MRDHHPRLADHRAVQDAIIQDPMRYMRIDSREIVIQQDDTGLYVVCRSGECESLLLTAREGYAANASASHQLLSEEYDTVDVPKTV